MYLSKLTITNFRQFGMGDPPFTLAFNPGVTALVGENDAGKTAIVDAIRYVLLTRDADYLKVQDEDFHISPAGDQAREITICCRLSDLSLPEKGAFAEFLTYNKGDTCLYVHWQACRAPATPSSRRWVDVSVHSGPDGSGPALDTSARQRIAAAYLKPLRDAEREMSPGRGSRLSQILGMVRSVRAGESYDAKAFTGGKSALERLSLLGLSDLIRDLVVRQAGLREAESSINSRYLDRLTLRGESLQGRIHFTEDGTDETRLRRLLERLELGLLGPEGAPRGTYGLGSNNLLFMACELLLLGNEAEGLPLLLIEEPEAHLHPQRQLRLMQFLEQAAKPDPKSGRRSVQVILTTHSPNLASQISVENLVLLKNGQAFPLAQDLTRLEKDDYRFLQRFLDVTKANLFFAGGVFIVEGDAEAILIPTLAKLLGRDLTAWGVSIVNVGGTGLRRYSRILQRSEPDHEGVGIPVACVTDLDVMPDCAPELLGLAETKNRRWRKRSDFGDNRFEQEKAIQKRRKKLCEGDGQGVCTFVADHWTLEYDLAFAGLEAEVFEAAWLAMNDTPLNEERKDLEAVRAEAKIEWLAILEAHPDDQARRCAVVYQLFHSGKASKVVGAQYLAGLLEKLYGTDRGDLEAKLPPYLLRAIKHVTEPISGPTRISVAEHCGHTRG